MPNTATSCEERPTRYPRVAHTLLSFFLFFPILPTIWVGIPALFHLGSYPEAPGPSAFSVYGGYAATPWEGLPPHRIVPSSVWYLWTEGNAATPWEGLPPHRIVPQSWYKRSRGSAATPWEGLPPHRIASLSWRVCRRHVFFGHVGWNFQGSHGEPINQFSPHDPGQWLTAIAINGNQYPILSVQVVFIPVIFLCECPFGPVGGFWDG